MLKGKVVTPIDHMNDDEILKIYNELCYLKKSIGEWTEKTE